MINKKEVYHQMWRPIFFIAYLSFWGYCLESVVVKWNHPIFKAFFFNQRMFTAISSFCLCSRSLTLLAQNFKGRFGLLLFQPFLWFFLMKCFVSFEVQWGFLCGFFKIYFCLFVFCGLFGCLIFVVVFIMDEFT